MAKYGKLYPVSFGFAWGIVSGVGLLLWAWLGARYGHGLPLTNLMSHFYYNYEPTFTGGLWGLLLGFVHGFIFGTLVAWIYNLSCKCFCPGGSCESCE